MLFCCISCQREIKQSDPSWFFTEFDKECRNVEWSREAKSLLDLKPNNLSDSLNLIVAAGKMQDSLLSDFLVEMMLSKNGDIRGEAAFGIGQLRDSSFCSNLSGFLDAEGLPAVRENILEALGKCECVDELEAITLDASPEDTYGVLKGIYRLGLVKELSSDMQGFTFQCLELGRNTEFAAMIFSRNRNLINSDLANEIFTFLHSEEVTNETKMFLTSALISLDNPQKLHLAQEAIDSKDPLLQINSIRLLSSVPLDSGLYVLEKYIEEPQNNQVVLLASQQISEKYENRFEQRVNQLIDQSNDLRLVNTLKNAILLKEPNDEMLNKLWDRKQTDYQRKALVPSYVMLQNAKETNLNWLKDKSLLIRSAMFEELLKSEEKIEIKGRLTQIAIELMDPALLSMMAVDLRTMSQDKVEQDLILCKELIEIIPQLDPFNDLEAIVEIKRTATELGLRNDQQTRNKSNFKPINWEILESLGEDPRVEIRTTKGTIGVELYTSVAPATVSNFLELCRKRSYQKRFFHRVVPNFVIQTGCPRGDGWGSEDYIIPSEYNWLPYEAGAIGMASAGKDTESCQWFITHRNTMHLDGRYTLFGKVYKGMEVVLNIDEGDEVLGYKIVR